MFSDADFAGCAKTLKSTSGVFLKIQGPNTSVGLSAISKKQDAISHSTTEAEIIAAGVALRMEGIPVLEILDEIINSFPGGKLTLEFYEDNQTTMRILETGKNPTLRYMGRTHNVNMRSLFDCFQSEVYRLRFCSTDQQAADIFTKHFTNPEKWRLVCRLINHCDKNKLFVKDLGLDLTMGLSPKKRKELLEAQITDDSDSEAQNRAAMKLILSKAQKERLKKRQKKSVDSMPESSDFGETEN